MKRALGLLTMLAIAMAVLTSTWTPTVEAQHDKRIVMPYGLDERWVPVLAGFEVVPSPLQCDSGTASGSTLASWDFETAEGYELTHSLTHNNHDNGYNIWHDTTFAGGGTDEGHGGDGRLYFGNDASGTYHAGGQRVSGAASFDIELPAGDIPYHLAFNTKWHTEWLEGYDHMWIEIQPGDGRTYILCTLNPDGRGDPTSSDQTVGACSPYRTPCPNDLRFLDPLSLGDNIDNGAPYWEPRSVEIPPLFNGGVVQMRFTFDSADGVANRYSGWMIDDLVLTDSVVHGVPMAGLIPV